jgi:gluconolactonase
MFAAPPVLETRTLLRLPDVLRRTRDDWPGPDGRPLDCFLEGPTFDRYGDLFFVDIPNGRVLRAAAEEVRVVAEYDGEPNGLKFHHDGRLFIADHMNGLMACDLCTGRVEPVLERAFGERFKGLNDLVFDHHGNLYFTDQGNTGLQDPSGRLFRLGADGSLRLLLGNIPSPNGIAISPDGRVLYLAVTRGNCLWRMPLLSDGSIGKAGLFIQLSGSLGGPDGIAVDAAGNIAIAHIGLGTVWIFSRIGEPLLRIRSCAGLLTSNIAYGGPENRLLYITESESGSILVAETAAHGLSQQSERDTQRGRVQSAPSCVDIG